MQVLSIANQALHLVHLLNQLVQLTCPVRNWERGLLPLLLFLLLIIFFFCLLLLFGVNYFYFRVFTLRVVQQHLKNLAGADVAVHFKLHFLCMVSIVVCDYVFLGFLDQILDMRDMRMITLVDLKHLHLESEVPLTNKSRSSSIHILNEDRVQLYSQILRSGHLIIQNFHTFQNRFVVLDVMH